MQVVLNSDVKKLGYRGDIVNVKDGYFRNFLLPRGLADVATSARLKLAEVRKESAVLRKQEVVGKAEDVLKKLKGLSVIVKAKTTEKGKLYAGISEKEVLEAIEAQAKVELDKDFIKMEHFKEIGEHEAKIVLGEGVEETIKVVVEPKE